MSKLSLSIKENNNWQNKQINCNNFKSKFKMKINNMRRNVIHGLRGWKVSQLS